MPTLFRLFFSTSTSPTRDSRAVVAIRAAVGLVFLVSGAVKFAYPNQGPGRFAKLELPSPEFLASFVGAVEIVAGALLVVGLVTRVAALALVIDMIAALAITKVPLLSGAGPEPVHAPPQTGLFAFLYQARLDLTMLLACAFLAVVGAGLLSADAWLARRLSERKLLGAVRELRDARA